MEFIPYLLAIIILIYLLTYWKKDQRGLVLSLGNPDFSVRNILLTPKTKLMVQITVNQQVSGQVQAQDRKGKPAPVESGTVSYTSSNEEVFTVEEDETDETKFKVLAQGAGAAELRISADADLGTGVETIETFSAVEIIPEKAVGFGITFGTPEDKPEPPVEE